jgi:hypothetical protein
MAQKRTTTRSRAGAQLYVKRSQTGQFTDIQSDKRAHGRDVKAEGGKPTSRMRRGAAGAAAQEE